MGNTLLNITLSIFRKQMLSKSKYRGNRVSAIRFKVTLAATPLHDVLYETIIATAPL